MGTPRVGMGLRHPRRSSVPACEHSGQPAAQAANIAVFGCALSLFVIGLTGGIASGKSTVAALLAERGAAVVDADKLGHQAYARGRSAFARVVDAFGADVVGDDGEIDRRTLGRKVFGNATELRRLTDIVWPSILALAQGELTALRRSGAAVAVLEAAVLLEAGWESEVDEVWAVTVAPAVAVARAMERDGVAAEAVRARIDAQLPNAEREAKAHVVIDNTAARAALVARVEREWRRLGKAA